MNFHFSKPDRTSLLKELNDILVSWMIEVVLYGIHVLLYFCFSDGCCQVTYRRSSTAQILSRIINLLCFKFFAATVLWHLASLDCYHCVWGFLGKTCRKTVKCVNLYYIFFFCHLPVESLKAALWSVLESVQIAVPQLFFLPNFMSTSLTMQLY